MKVVPLTSFIHGAINAEEGHPIEVPDGTAADLERAGLVRISSDKAVAVGKPVDDGAGQPSSASPPAPPLQTKTLRVSKPGVTKAKPKVVKKKGKWSL